MAAFSTAPVLAVDDVQPAKSPLIFGSSADHPNLEANVQLGALAPDMAVQFGVGAGFGHQTRADIDDGGRFSVSRFNARLSARLPITEQLRLSLGLRYDLDDYDFSGTTMLAPVPGVMEPWEDIHTLSFASILTLILDEEWSVFGGPVFQMSRESGADAGDSWIAGGSFGVQYVASPKLTLGLGAGITSQIEDSARFFPVIILHWELMENLWLSTRDIAETTGDPGVELLYDWGGGFETAIGVAYRFRRFRLESGGGVAPDGVGEHSYIPAWLRIGYRVSPNLHLGARVGLALAGRMRLESSSGSKLGEEDHDPAAIFGVNASFRF